MILCTPIPIVFFSGFPTWGFHNHFVEINYITRGPIGKNIVYYGSFLPYSNNPPYLCFPFVGRWYAYSRSSIRCGSCFFTIRAKVFNIKTFSAVKLKCVVWSPQGLDHSISFFPCFLFLIRIFIFWAHWWDLDHLLNRLWLKLFMMILGWYIISLCL